MKIKVYEIRDFWNEVIDVYEDREYAMERVECLNAFYGIDDYCRLVETEKEEESVEMKVYVVWMDDEREFASYKWQEAQDRYLQLLKGFGEDRVDVTVEYA
jgi:hypothetical protein